MSSIPGGRQKLFATVGERTPLSLSNHFWMVRRVARLLLVPYWHQNILFYHLLFIVFLFNVQTCPESPQAAQLGFHIYNFSIISNDAPT